MTQVSTPIAAHTIATSAASGDRHHVRAVANAAIEVTMPGTPSTPLTVSPTSIVGSGIGNGTRREGSTVWSMPDVSTGRTVQPRMSTAPASTMTARATSIGAKLSPMSPATTPTRRPRP